VSPLRSGFVAIAGLPNAGKSTLLNRLVGEHLAITSPKPQTTRDRVVGIRTDEQAQMIFVDTPGLLDPEYELHHRMRATARRAVLEADVVVYVTDITNGVPVPLDSLIGTPIQPPVVVALNKTDVANADVMARVQEVMPGGVMHSAAQGNGVDALLAAIADRLPEGPALYPADDLTTQPARFFASEYVREAALDQLEDEVPYAVACVVEEYREDRSPVYIRATLFVERESQKRILIGASGVRIREVGRAARQRIETLIGAPVYLDLWVKVQPRWRRDPHVLDRLGYRLPG
jgi:GTP-binding protein Era